MWQHSRRRAQTNRRDQGQSGKLSTRSCVQSFPSAFAFLFEVALFFVNLPIVGRTFVCFRRRFCSPAQFFLGAFTQSGTCMSFVPLFKVLVSCTQKPREWSYNEIATCQTHLPDFSLLVVLYYKFSYPSTNLSSQNVYNKRIHKNKPSIITNFLAVHQYRDFPLIINPRDPVKLQNFPVIICPLRN